MSASVWERFGNLTHPNATCVLRDPRLVNGSAYQFKVRAYDKVGLASDFCLPVGVLHWDHLSPAAPKNLTAVTISESEITLRWNASDPDTMSYKVYVNATGKGVNGNT